MLPEERARVRIDKQLSEAGWDIVARKEYVPKSAAAVKEALMQGNTESDYLLFVDDKAIAVVEAKREENPLADDVENQAEGYSSHPQGWYGLWFDKQIPLVYLANGNKIYFKNMLQLLPLLRMLLHPLVCSGGSFWVHFVYPTPVRLKFFVRLSILERHELTTLSAFTKSLQFQTFRFCEFFLSNNRRTISPG